ncbi:hypothetical protein J5N97_019437 [Dioscorea zingiberensis]|uniref:Uncharacterized protein n=1 Tax=Dioscorea zingiberensis TaxID=325984 RepID=A0A9D5HCV5_9LILI|nr:hypothetical protein J5N97_019437 [Dioscorea zingiberensis]
MAKKLTDATRHQMSETVDGRGVAEAEKTGHAAATHLADSDPNGQLMETQGEMDFAESIRLLTATWHHPMPRSDDSGSPLGLDKPAQVAHTSLVDCPSMAPDQLAITDGPHPTVGPDQLNKESAAGPEGTAQGLGWAQSPSNQALEILVETGPHQTNAGPMPTNIVMDFETNENSLSSPYPLSPFNPIHNFIKTLVTKIEADLKKATLRQIANT